MHLKDEVIPTNGGGDENHDVAESKLRLRKLSQHSHVNGDQGSLNGSAPRKLSRRLSKEEEGIVEKSAFLQQIILDRMKDQAMVS